MKTDRHARIKQVFSEAVELPHGERDRYLEETCAADAALRDAVDALLHADEQTATGVLRDPVYLPAARTGPRPLDAAIATAEEDRLPDFIGNYRLIRKLGEGGMGAVYEAEQDHPRRRVALKTIRPDVATQSLSRRFSREAELLGQLQHPGIAQVFDAGTHVLASGVAVPYFAMELVDGCTLDRYLRDRAPTTRERLTLLAMVCDAVHHAHQRGVIHRDLKPGNILVVEGAGYAAQEGSGFRIQVSGKAASAFSQNPEHRTLNPQPKILDFGVARIIDSDVNATLRTDAGQIVGTLGYMSPEQVSEQSDQIDARSDVYALGIILYETLAERPPYDVRGRSLPDAVRMIREDEPTRLSFLDHRLRGDIETIVAKALEKDRQRRYASAAELAADIRRYLHDEPIHARPISTFYQLRKFARRNRGLVTGLGIAALVLLVGGIVSGILAVRENQQRKRAELQTRRAQAREEEAHRLAYRASIAAASSALQSGDSVSARTSLAETPAHLRGWEWRYYSYLADRSLHTFSGHTGLITMSISADGETLATADSRPFIRLWSVSLGELKKTIPVPSASSHMSIRPDATSVLWSDCQSRTALIDANSGAVLWQRDVGLSLSTDAFSPDGETFAAGQLDGQPAAVFDANSGLLQGLFEQPSPVLASPIFAPQGAHVLLRYADGDYVMTDAATRRPLWRGGAWNHAFAPDGSFCVLENTNAGVELKLFEAHSGAVLRRIDLGARLLEKWAFRPGGLDLTIADSSGTIEVMDAATLNTRARVPAHRGIGVVRYSPDGRRLISSGLDGEVRIWDAALLAAPTLVHPPRYELSYGAAVSPDGRRVARVGWGCVSLWDSQTTAVRWRTFVSRNFLRAVAFRPDSSQLAIGGQGGRILLLETETGSVQRTVTVPDATLILSLGWFPDGQTVLAALDTGELRTIHVESGDQAVLGRHDSPAICCAISSDGAMVASGSGNGLPGGDLGVFATSVDDCSIRIWDVAKRAERQRLAGHTGAITCVALSSNGDLLASGSLDQSAALWNTRSGERLLVLREIGRPVRAITLSSDGSRIIVATEESLRVWSSASGELLASLPCGVKAGTNAIAFSPDAGSLIVSGEGLALGLFECQPPACGEPARELAARAKRLIEQLETRFELSADMIESTVHANGLSSELRNAAVEQMRAIGDPVTRFVSDAIIAGFVAGPPDEFELPLRKVESAVQTFPSDWRLLSVLGLIEFRAGKIERARSTLGRAEAAFAENGLRAPMYVQIVLSIVDFQSGELDRSRNRLREVRTRLEESPDLLDRRYSYLLLEAVELIDKP